MFKYFRTSALIALAVLPVMATTASAQNYESGCRRSNENNTATGAVVGGVAGALLGSAIAGRHDRVEGAVVGGVGGAIVGSAVAGANQHPCPPGYYYAAPQAPPPPPPPPPEMRRDQPMGIHERIDFLQARLDHAIGDGRLSRRAAREISRDLDNVRRSEDHLRARDGGHLSPGDRDYLMQRADGVDHHLDFAAR